jgi:UDP-glucose 4-epimerase
LKAKLVSKETNPSSRTKLFIQEIRTNVWKSDNPLQRYLNADGGHESDLISEDRTNLVPFFFGEIAVGSLPELNVLGNDYRTIEVTEGRDYIDVMDVPNEKEKESVVSEVDQIREVLELSVCRFFQWASQPKLLN